MMDPSYTGAKMEARENTGSTVVEVPREPGAADLGEEPRVYGSRWVKVEGADGRLRFEEEPLTWEDLFDPREGDRLMHSPKHGKTLRDTAARLECLYEARGRDDVAVYDDVRFDWKTPGVAPACPDVGVIPGMKKVEKGQSPESFDEAKEGTSPCFVLEVTSKKTADYDRTSKPSIYRRARVPEIFLLDAMKSPWELSGQRRHPQTGRYRKVRPEPGGRLLAETLSVYFSVSAGGDDLVMEDAETGEMLRKPVQESQARRAAERRAAEEAAARRREAEAREAAERQAVEAAAAQEAAEQQAAEAAAACAAAEATVQELLAKIQRLASSDD